MMKYDPDMEYGFVAIPETKGVTMQAWLATVVRKLVVGASAVWIAKLVETGLFSQQQADALSSLTIQFILAVALIIGSAGWTFIKKRFFGAKE